MAVQFTCDLCGETQHGVATNAITLNASPTKTSQEKLLVIAKVVEDPYSGEPKEDYCDKCVLRVARGALSPKGVATSERIEKALWDRYFATLV